MNEYNTILLNFKALKYNSYRSSNIYVCGYNKYEILLNKKEVFFHKLISTTNEYKFIRKYSFKEFIDYQAYIGAKYE